MRSDRFPGRVGHGTLLRHLTELLDGDVERVYQEQGLDCRSRYTPVFRHIDRHGPSSIRTMAGSSGLTHSAMSQTVGEMLRKGLVESAPGEDGRERIISLSRRGKALLKKLKPVWEAIGAASEEINRETSSPLTDVLEEAIGAVGRASFRQRILRNLHRSTD